MLSVLSCIATVFNNTLAIRTVLICSMQMYHIIVCTVYLRGIGTVINYLTSEKQICSKRLVGRADQSARVHFTTITIALHFTTFTIALQRGLA